MTMDIAVIGIGCRLPGATGPAELWDLIRSGRTTFEPVDSAEALRFGYTQQQLREPAYVPVRSALPHFDMFDAEFFGISHRDAALMDPQHRIFIETVWSTLTDAGYADDFSSLRIGMFGSSSTSTYLTGPVADAGMWRVNDINFSAMLGNDKDFLSTRASYTLGLTGPSVVVQSACSSSLLAVHLAKASLANGECDLAIVGGVSISLPHLGGYLQRPGDIFSPSGVCRPFDADADGTVKAHGATAVALVPVENLDPRRDRVYAVIAGSAVNNDGRDKAGFAAPGVAGQVAVVEAAIVDSGLLASDVRYVETHGTGTALGDPIEIRALSRGRGGRQAGLCYLGSIKATLGHLDSAAGITGLVKASLVLHHQVVPPLAGFARPNPLLSLDDDGFVAPVHEVLPEGGIPAAGVSSFGMGGTNVHVLLRRANHGDGSGSSRDRALPYLTRTRHWITDASFIGSIDTQESQTRSPQVSEDDVLAVVRQVMSDPGLQLETDLFDAGADSLDAIDLLDELRGRWPVDITYSTIEKGRTPLALTAAIRAGLTEASVQSSMPAGQLDPSQTVDRATGKQESDCLVPISSSVHRPLFLVHPAGGTTSCYVDLARHVDDAVSVIGLAFPDDFLGRSVTMRHLAAHYLAAIRSYQPEGPYLIGGYSFGGNLAAEIALQLQVQGDVVERLVMIDSHPPHAYTSGQCSDSDYLEAFPTLLQTLMPEVRFSDEDVDRSSAQRVLDQVSEPLWASGVRTELARFFEIWCENHRALKQWTPDTLITCPALILRASDPEPEEIIGHLGITNTAVDEWERYLSGPVAYADIEGDHYTIFRDPDALRRMGQVLQHALA